MDRDLDVLTLLLLDPCLTADEAAREAAARTHTAGVVAEARTRPHATGRKARRAAPEATDGPSVGF
ncbi:hypothetical protein [Frigoriglobus tundricola]|uniref:Uncharacterized protein n=1 Tax=Frigoriglobus tundricola TaxID=2774151 RepID=A0A6M5YHS9_9BACT|nr:hypothetical protein [Frigoriglobus tundricola]QJW93607.1 hypothetical protein FTUN_1115 [Frigoriglobus tundricola]